MCENKVERSKKNFRAMLVCETYKSRIKRMQIKPFARISFEKKKSSTFCSSFLEKVTKFYAPWKNRWTVKESKHFLYLNLLAFAWFITEYTFFWILYIRPAVTTLWKFSFFFQHKSCSYAKRILKSVSQVKNFWV